MSKIDSPVISEVIQRLQDGSRQYYLKEGNNTVATVVVTLINETDYEIKGLWINPEYRRMGFARALISRVKKEYLGTKLVATVRSDYAALMRELGFRKVESVDKWELTDNALES